MARREGVEVEERPRHEVVLSPVCPGQHFPRCLHECLLEQVSEESKLRRL